ncbi:hypothetical protein C8R45DRAFT_1070186 [Mycena sanguinolenta]|nr:hypothetical protein C8R45DRAFT_1070186 [Mycena sanguinolenta]
MASSKSNQKEPMKFKSDPKTKPDQRVNQKFTTTIKVGRGVVRLKGELPQSIQSADQNFAGPSIAWARGDGQERGPPGGECGGMAFESTCGCMIAKTGIFAAVVTRSEFVECVDAHAITAALEIVFGTPRPSSAPCRHVPSLIAIQNLRRKSIQGIDPTTEYLEDAIVKAPHCRESLTPADLVQQAMHDLDTPAGTRMQSTSAYEDISLKIQRLASFADSPDYDMDPALPQRNLHSLYNSPFYALIQAIQAEFEVDISIGAYYVHRTMDRTTPERRDIITPSLHQEGFIPPEPKVISIRIIVHKIQLMRRRGDPFSHWHEIQLAREFDSNVDRGYLSYGAKAS